MKRSPHASRTTTLGVATILAALFAAGCASAPDGADASSWQAPIEPTRSGAESETIPAVGAPAPRLNGFSGPLPKQADLEVPVFSSEVNSRSPRAQTFQLARDDAGPGSNADVRAHVFWGVGSEQHEFFLDWNHGAGFSLVASWVRIAARSYAPNLSLPYEASQGSLQISAASAEGTGASQTATFTESLVLADHDATLLLAPDFAKSVLCIASNVTPETLAALQATMLAAGSLDMGEVTFPEFRQYLTTGVVLPGGARQLLVQDLEHSGGVVVTVTWFLSL